MPLTCCPTCGMTVYSAAGHSTRDECAQCGSELPPVAAGVTRTMRRRYLVKLDGFLRRTGRAQKSWLLRQP
jgi:anaerobic ribonucleoside-triphosphate reductase